MTICPTCEQPVDAKLLVDLATNTIAVDRFRWEVGRKQALFMHALVRAWPRAVTEEELCSLLWGENSNKRAIDLATYLSRARDMLRPFGFTITHCSSQHQLKFPVADQNVEYLRKRGIPWHRNRQKRSA